METLDIISTTFIFLMVITTSLTGYLTDKINVVLNKDYITASTGGINIKFLPIYIDFGSKRQKAEKLIKVRIWVVIIFWISLILLVIIEILRNTVYSI